MDITQATTILKQLENNIETIIIGKQKQIRLILAALLSRGHILLEDTPGTGKTKLAKAITASIDGSFKRVQFTPDLLPSDVTGINIYNQKTQEFEFVKGPVFANLLLADEINRATPRTQSCLLEAMAERQITIDGVTRPLPEPFFLIATENLIETTGTFPLPEAQLDRFDLKLSLGFPSPEEDILLLDRYLDSDPEQTLSPVCSLADLSELCKLADTIYLHPDIRQYIVSIIQATRNHEQLALGINPRGMLSLAKLSRAYALLCGRNYVIPEDVKALVKPCLGHRLLSLNTLSGQALASAALDDILSTIPVPTEKFD